MDFTDIYKRKLLEEFNGIDKYCKRKLALMCIERQFKSYCKFSDSKNWGRRFEYRELLDILWDTVLKQQVLNEEIWELHERIRPENINVSNEEKCGINYAYSNIFATNVETLLETLLDDLDHEEDFLLFNINFILNFLNEDNLNGSWECDKFKNNELIVMEINNQKNDMKSVSELKTIKDIQRWSDNCSDLLLQ